MTHKNTPLLDDTIRVAREIQKDFYNSSIIKKGFKQNGKIQFRKQYTSVL